MARTKEEQREYDRKYRELNRERIRVQNKERAQRTKSSLVWGRRNPEKRMLIGARTNAKRRGLEFTITVDDIHIPDVCPVLGIPLYVAPIEIGGVSPNSPSIDRINNELGYVPGNIRVISWRANNLKRDATADELEAVAKYLRES